MKNIKEQVYGSKKALDTMKKRLRKNRDISNKNIHDIIKFVDHGQARGFSEHTLIKYIKHLRIFAELLEKDFKNANKNDIEIAFSELYERNYADETIETYKNIICAYWRWLFDLESKDRLPDCVRWIQHKKLPSKLTKENLLTSEELNRLILAAEKIEYKALICVAADTGLRPGELLQLTNRDVFITPEYTKINVCRGKTSKINGPREVFLIKSESTFMNWYNNHPLKEQEVYPLWVNQNLEPISVQVYWKMLQRLKNKAGIKKRVYGYIFRHGKATELYKTKPASVVSKVMGHSEKMARTYMHLDSQDVYEVLSGKKLRKEEKSRVCLCGKINELVADVCIGCGRALTERGAISKQDEVKNIVKQMLEMNGYKDVVKLEALSS